MFSSLSLRHFTIRLRMQGAIGLVLALLLLLGATGLSGLRQVDRIGSDFVAQTHAATLTLAELRTALGNVRRFEKDVLINYDNAAEVLAYRAKWSNMVTATQAAASTLALSGPADQTAAAATIGTLMKQYAAGASTVFKQVEVGGFNDAPVANRAIAPAKKFAHEAELQIDRLQAELARQAAASGRAREDATRQAGAVFAGACVLAMLLVVPLTLANTASICKPIEQARQWAERIATGDLASSVSDTGRDEAAHLLTALHAMQVSLRSIVGQVRESADSIQVASAEVASGNTDLSERTEQAAADLQQTAGSLEQLTGNVRQSADAAAQANQLAASASAVAQRGGQVVNQVVLTMDEINLSSKRIADIIGTIDGIAFQTNILALNAAVEAARAGEQGRGFAVVASEVRSLAQRSAEAAREIKTLIGTSVEKVETGARLVQDAGSTMGEIVASVQRVTDVIGEITAAAEQSHGINEVNAAISSLDQMTQQNAALVEESAAAAESLNDQARRLSQSMGVFRLSVGHATNAAATPTPAAVAPRSAAAPAPAHKSAYKSN